MFSFPRRQLPFLLTASVAAALVSGCADAAPFNPDRLPPSEVAGVQAACRSILVLDPGEAHDLGCFESLSRSLAGAHAARSLAAARQACLVRGLAPSTGDFAVCVVQGGQGEPPAPIRLASLQDLAVPGGHRSFAYTSNADRRRREQLACAALGLDPAGGAFDSCVADLAATMFELDNPPS